MGGAALLIASLTLGILAHQASQSEALQRWHRESSPGPLLWRSSLGGLGFEFLENPAERHVALRSLPATLDTSATVWSTSDLRWVAVYSSSETDPEPRLYRRPGAGRPEAWKQIGVGWNGLQALLETLEKLPKPAPSKAAAAPRQRRRDPRELAY